MEEMCFLEREEFCDDRIEIGMVNVVNVCQVGKLSTAIQSVIRVKP